MAKKGKTKGKTPAEKELRHIMEQIYKWSKKEDYHLEETDMLICFTIGALTVFRDNITKEQRWRHI